MKAADHYALSALGRASFVAWQSTGGFGSAGSSDTWNISSACLSNRLNRQMLLRLSGSAGETFGANQCRRRVLFAIGYTSPRIEPAIKSCANATKALNGGTKPVRRGHHLRSQEAFKWQRVSLSAISRTLTSAR
ncbi:hypothetical protein QD460_31830, partial [Rhizobium jaguaris]|uniref:hypothetical protein n=1 Tax=Rhizobium jaguaris TaxID=1312183 RepID=UPI0039BFAA81